MITIPGKPMSANKRLGFNRKTGKAYPNGAYKTYKEMVALIVPKNPTSGDIRLAVTFYFRNPKADIDNALKALLDGLQGQLYFDDNQIVELHVIKKIDRDNPRTEIERME